MVSMSDKASSEKTDGNWSQMFSSGAFAKLANALIPHLPPDQQGFLLLATFVVMLALPVSGLLIWSGQYVIAFCVVGAVLIFLVIITFMIANRTLPNIASTNAFSPSVPTWTRLVPKLPIPERELSELNDALNSIRRDALAKIKEIAPNHSATLDSIRVNIFLPDTRFAAEGEVCGLFIPKQLHSGMQDEPERGIRFRPSEGITGRVFCRQRALAASAIDTQNAWTAVPVDEADTTIDEATFCLSDDQRKRIHDSLKWIFSFPLLCQDGTRQVTMGVLNVDCIQYDLSERDMKLLFGALALKVVSLSRKFAELPKNRVTITVEELHDV